MTWSEKAATKKSVWKVLPLVDDVIGKLTGGRKPRLDLNGLTALDDSWCRKIYPLRRLADEICHLLTAGSTDLWRGE